MTINGIKCTEPGTVLKAEDEVVLIFDSSRRYKEQKGSLASGLFEIFFEDNYLLVINKAAGFLTMPTEKREKVSLIDAVNYYLSIRGNRSDGATLVHRLDRDTSGVLVIAKHPNLAQTLKAQFAERKPKRRYVAIVRGTLAKRSGTFESYLATDGDLNQYSTKDTEKGKLAITHYKVVKEFDDTTLVEVHLETGRRNQIRVHFAEKGHPVIGDVRYRPKLATHAEWPMGRVSRCTRLSSLFATL